jgi:hypothetical protein
MSESIFLADGERFTPTEHARGPWGPETLHGGAPAALLTSLLQRVAPGAELPIARLGFELLRPIPNAPLTIKTRIVRPGRRVQELAGELRCGEELVCRASALRVLAVPGELPGVPAGTAPEAEAMPGPDEGRRFRFALDDPSRASFAASAMEMSWISDPQALGPGRVWMRLRQPLLPGQEITPLASLAAAADFGNGVSAVLPFESFVFINADLAIHLHRPPLGEWIGLDARTLLHGGGTGLAESILHDIHGAVGRGFQSLVVQPR